MSSIMHNSEQADAVEKALRGEIVALKAQIANMTEGPNPMTPAQNEPIAWCLAYTDLRMGVIHSNPSMCKHELDCLSAMNGLPVVPLFTHALPTDADKRDAERYRKFRAMHQQEGGNMRAVTWLGNRVMQDLDAAIDAAMKGGAA